MEWIFTVTEKLIFWFSSMLANTLNVTSSLLSLKKKAIVIIHILGLPDSMNKLAKLLTTLFVFLCICLFSLFFFDSTNDGLA